MRVLRIEFNKAIGFIKHVISESEDAGADNCLRVRFEADRCILTGGNQYAGKLVTLVSPVNEQIAIDGGGKKPKDGKPEDPFMVSWPTLIAFKALLDKHKAKEKKLTEADTEGRTIEITSKELVSFGTKVTNQKPACDYKNIEGLFIAKKSAISETGVTPAGIGSIMDGFDNSSPIITTFTGDGNPIHFHQPASGYKAYLVPSSIEEDDGKD